MATRRLHIGIGLAVCLLAACTSGKKKAAAIGEAYAGPMQLNLREEIRPSSRAVTSVKHGEKLDILQVRRRFVRVRAPGGQEGWTEVRQLLNTQQMTELRELARVATKLPSQGQATVFGALNLHNEPSRYAPSFYRLTEGVKVEVVGHKLTERAAETRQQTKLDIRKAVAPPRKKKEPKIPPPPKGPPPALPPNWLALSRTVFPPPPPPPPEPEPPPGVKKKKKRPPKVNRIPMDDWSLVRTRDGKAGWALTRMLVMGIPDEVAQYSEGARITSYFPLGTVHDAEFGVDKHHWLWTTIREGLQPYQFDSFRVFIWHARRHRYETAFIERNLKGYYPIEVKRGSPTTFSLLIEEEDGQVFRRHYVFEGILARQVGKTPAKKPLDIEALEAEEEEDDEQELAAAGEGSTSFADRVRSWKRKIWR